GPDAKSSRVMTRSWSAALSEIPRSLCIAAALSRLIFFLLVYLHPQICLLSDSSSYLTLARNLATYHVFSQGTPPIFPPETFRTPGYPLFLTPFAMLFSDPILWIAFAQSLLGFITVIVTWLWLRPITGARGAYWGAIAIALDLIILFHTPLLL